MPNNRTKVTNDQIRSFITDNPATIREVGLKFAVTPATARKHLVSLFAAGLVSKFGVKAAPEGARGRSPDLYVVQTAAPKAATLVDAIPLPDAPGVNLATPADLGAPAAT